MRTARPPSSKVAPYRSRIRSRAGRRKRTDWPKSPWRDRKSTRLNSSHGYISYAVFCLKKKKKAEDDERPRMLFKTDDININMGTQHHSTHRMIRHRPNV